ncbi:cysteine dioxygenase [Candidatus Poriferisodalis sp.]|uniref:cysteine dioxygenase n=1 Tax=Candidatus Poriferisodalis sp. TaxID=3101277 RepID=UPI003B5C60C0
MSAPDMAAERATERAVAVADAMEDIAKIDAHGREHGGIDRGGVERIRERLLQLAERDDLFPLEDFPPPAEGRSTRMYRIAQNDDDELALYVQSVRDGTAAPPHEHTTWAVIVGMRGQELNRFYDRCADEGEPQAVREVMVERCTGVAMLGHDLHSIHIEGASTNFHCYGLALERLKERRFWHADDSEWRVYYDVGHIVEARPGHPATAVA